MMCILLSFLPPQPPFPQPSPEREKERENTASQPYPPQQQAQTGIRERLTLSPTPPLGRGNKTDSCTLSIILLDRFVSRAPLPGAGSGAPAFEQSDTATYRDIYAAARVVEQDCLLPSRRPGWEAVGEFADVFF